MNHLIFFFVLLVSIVSGRAEAVQPYPCEEMVLVFSNFTYGPRNTTTCQYEGDYCDGYFSGIPVDGCILAGPPRPIPCEDRRGTVYSSGHYDMGLSSENDPPTIACDDSCETSYTGSGISSRTTIDGIYHYGAEGSYTFTGAECSAGDPSPGSSAAPPETSCDPETQVEGVIAGQTICFTRGDLDVQTDVTIDPVTGDRTDVTTITQPDGSSTTTTTVKSTDPITGSTSETSTTTSNPVPDQVVDPFCVDHPDDPTCLADAVGPVGDGALGGECALNPNTLGCATLDGTIASDPLQTEIRDIALISPVSLGGVGQCPAPLVATFLGQKVEFLFDPLCEFANSLRPVVLVLAWLSAGVIFIGGVRS